MRTPPAVLSTVLVLLAGCAKPDSDNPPADSHAAADSLANIVGVPGTSGSTVVEQMELHLKATRELTTDSMKSLLPRHRELAEKLIAVFNEEMRGMNVAAAPAWSAIVDSLRADLRAMPSLQAADLQVRMPAHDARLVRLIQMHQAMVKGGNK